MCVSISKRNVIMKEKTVFPDNRGLAFQVKPVQQRICKNEISLFRAGVVIKKRDIQLIECGEYIILAESALYRRDILQDPEAEDIYYAGLFPNENLSGRKMFF